VQHAVYLFLFCSELPKYCIRLWSNMYDRFEWLRLSRYAPSLVFLVRLQGFDATMCGRLNILSSGVLIVGLSVYLFSNWRHMDAMTMSTLQTRLVGHGSSDVDFDKHLVILSLRNTFMDVLNPLCGPFCV